jgi:hypothetical protein
LFDCGGLLVATRRQNQVEAGVVIEHPKSVTLSVVIEPKPPFEIHLP